MKLHLDNASGEFRIGGYATGELVVNDVTYEGSLIVRVNVEPEKWMVSSIETLTDESLSILLEPRPEVLLLGTGSRQTFPDPAMLRALYGSGVGFEIMDTKAACRTFNILAAEGRQVVAAVFPLSG